MIALAFACSSPTLSLEGPAEVHVTHLGPVEMPVAKLSSGEPPQGLVWASDAAAVAGVDGLAVTAVGPGKATITGTWQDQSVSWALYVEPPMALLLLDPPATLAMGSSVKLGVAGKVADGTVPASGVSWASSDADLATVDGAGTVTGKSLGTVYITASNGKSDAMAEITIVP